MKLKITDVREVISELIAETWSPHDVQRLWKFPTDEEKARIEREVGMKLRWESILGSAKYDNFQEKWRMHRSYVADGVNGILYYAVGVTVRDINSTLDDGFGVVLVATAYDSPFGAPTEYWVAGYGPLPEMDDLKKVIEKNLFDARSSDGLIGGDRLDDWISVICFKRFVSRIIFREVVEFAHRMKMDIRVGSRPSDFLYTVQFSDKQHMQYAVNRSQNEIKIAIHKQFPHMKVQVHIDYTTTGGAEYSILIYNKWTNYRLGIQPLTNVDVEFVKNGKFTV